MHMARTPRKRIDLVIALLATGLRPADVAKRLGLTRQAIYELQQTEPFKERYRAVQSELLRGAADVMTAGAIAAAKTLVEVAANDRFEVRDRLVASKFLAETARAFLDRLKAEEKQDEAAAKPDFWLEQTHVDED
jgi:hypothetical protein